MCPNAPKFGIHCLFMGRIDIPISKYDRFNIFGKISFFSNFIYFSLYNPIYIFLGAWGTPKKNFKNLKKIMCTNIIQRNPKMHMEVGFEKKREFLTRPNRGGGWGVWPSTF